MSEPSPRGGSVLSPGVSKAICNPLSSRSGSALGGHSCHVRQAGLPSVLVRDDSREVGAACVWRSAEGWTGRRYHLGTNKEVFDAEVFAIYRALHVLAQRQESGRRYTIFVYSTAAIDRIRSDATGPGQRFAVASMEGLSGRGRPM